MKMWYYLVHRYEYRVVTPEGIDAVSPHICSVPCGWWSDFRLTDCQWETVL